VTSALLLKLKYCFQAVAAWTGPVIERVSELIDEALIKGVSVLVE
jgi:hypothetical protein